MALEAALGAAPQQAVALEAPVEGALGAALGAAVEGAPQQAAVVGAAPQVAEEELAARPLVVVPEGLPRAQTNSARTLASGRETGKGK